MSGTGIAGTIRARTRVARAERRDGYEAVFCCRVSNSECTSQLDNQGGGCDSRLAKRDEDPSPGSCGPI